MKIFHTSRLTLFLSGTITTKMIRGKRAIKWREREEHNKEQEQVGGHHHLTSNMKTTTKAAAHTVTVRHCAQPTSTRSKQQGGTQYLSKKDWRNRSWVEKSENSNSGTILGNIQFLLCRVLGGAGEFTMLLLGRNRYFFWRQIQKMNFAVSTSPATNNTTQQPWKLIFKRQS